MLHLQPRVHLQEVERAVLVDDALDRAGVLVAGLRGQGHRRLGEPRPQRVVHHRRGGLLDQLLVAALHRAVALSEEDDVASRVADHLCLHVVRALHVPLEEHLRPPEVRLRLTGGTPKRLLQVIAGAHDVHALAAASERGLHEQGEADPLGLLLGLPEVDRLRRTGDDGHAGGVGGAPSGGLVAHRLDRLRARPDEREARFLNGLSEVRALGEEAVSGMDHRRPGPPSGVQDRADRQVRGGRQGGPDAKGDVGHLHVQRVSIRVRVHGDGWDPELATRADEPHRDLPPVGDQDPRFHGHDGRHDNPWAPPHRRPERTLQMNDGDLRLALELAGITAPTRWHAHVGSTNAEAALWAGELLEMYRAIREGGTIKHDGYWGMATLELIAGVMQSGRERREITLTHQCPVRY